MRTKNLIAASILAAVGLLSSAPCAAQEADKGWDWVGTTYTWAPRFSADFSDNARVGDVDVSFSDLLEKTDIALNGHIEGQGDDYGVMFDLVYFGLSDTADRPRARIDADLSTTITDVAAVWSPGESRYDGIEVFGGLRYIAMDFEADVDPVLAAIATRRFTVDRSFTDALLGARYSMPLSPKWGFGVRVDTSFGSSEGSWNAAVNFRRSVGKRVFLIGYRYFNLEVQPREASFDIQLHGPQIAYAWTW